MRDETIEQHTSLYFFPTDSRQAAGSGIRDARGIKGGSNVIVNLNWVKSSLVFLDFWW